MLNAGATLCLLLLVFLSVNPAEADTPVDPEVHMNFVSMKYCPLLQRVRFNPQLRI